MESAVRETLLDAVADYSAIIEDIHLFEHWVVIRAGRYEMSTRFAAHGAPYRQTHETWMGDLIGKKAAAVAEEYLSSTDVLRIAVGMACLKCVLPSVAGFSEGSAMDFFHDAIREKPTCSFRPCGGVKKGIRSTLSNSRPGRVIFTGIIHTRYSPVHGWYS